MALTASRQPDDAEKPQQQAVKGDAAGDQAQQDNGLRKAMQASTG